MPEDQEIGMSRLEPRSCEGLCALSRQSDHAVVGMMGPVCAANSRLFAIVGKYNSKLLLVTAGSGKG